MFTIFSGERIKGGGGGGVDNFSPKEEVFEDKLPFGTIVGFIYDNYQFSTCKLKQNQPDK